jgi:hypothetical protein
MNGPLCISALCQNNCYDGGLARFIGTEERRTAAAGKNVPYSNAGELYFLERNIGGAGTLSS